MKLYVSQLNELYAKIKTSSFKSLLLYGPDKGYINKICAQLMKQHDLIQKIIPYQGLNVNQLEMMLNSKNFFGKKELIKVTNVSGSFDPELKVLLNTEFMNFVVFIADELPPTSAIRRHFEKEANLISVGCYHDDEQAIVRFILKKCQETGKLLDHEALEFLKLHLKGDHEIINSEIEKLICYVGVSKQITLNDATKVISVNTLVSYDDLCISFAEKDLENFLNEVEKLKHHNINEVSIIRSLIKYYLNLYIVLLREERGENLDFAIKTLTPPIFFKYLSSFKNIAKSLTITDVVKTLTALQKAEVKFKLSNNNFDFYNEVYLNINETN